MAETVNEYRETDLGNVAPNPRGDYSETAEYEYLDLVAYAGGSYMCILEEGTVTGTAPTPGKTTEIWQEVSRPGNLTPEYVALHDDVVNKAASVAEDAASVASDREQVEGMEENVAALQEQTAQDAQLTKEYRESAAGYASAAETSRTAAGESEENVRALVNGFDSHVKEQKQSAQENITASRQDAIKAIAAQQVSSVNSVKQEGQKAINKTNADVEATAADRAAVSEMAATVDSQAARVAQNAAQVAEDKVTAENYMQTAGESKKQALEAAERLKDSVNLVQKNTVDLQGKAPVIIGSATSYDGTPVEVNDSAEMQLQGLRLYGKSKQETTTGANLFDANDVSQGFISDDTGNNMVETDSYCSNFIAVSAKTKYYLHSDQNAGRWGAFYDSSKTFILGIATDKYNTVFETPENAAYIRFTVDYYNNNPNFARNVIFAKSTVALPFEPYTGGKPSPSPEYPQEIASIGENGSIDVGIVGKNLLGLFDFHKCYVSETNKFVSNSSSVSYSCETKKLPEKIVLSGNNINRNNISYTNKKPEAGTLFDIVNVKENPITIKKEYEYINIHIAYGSVPDNVQIEKGTEATSYEPYKQPQSFPIATPTGLPAIPVPSGTPGITYTDTDGQAWIADEIDFGRGKYVKRVWKGVFDGSSDEEWNQYWKVGTYATRMTWSDLVLPGNILCNRYIYGSGIGQFDSLLANGQLHLYFNYDNGIIGEKAFREIIASNPLVVMTYLDTPIETELTQEQLQAYKSLTTLKPTCIISNDAGALMEVEYVEETKAYIDGLNDAADTRIDVLTETIAENKKADKLAQRRIDVLWKLSQGIVYEFQSDDVDGYKKDVPTGGKYVGLKQIGGKSLVWGQLLKIGKCYFESVIKDHFYLLRGVANVTEKADVYGYVRPTGFTINTQVYIGKLDVGTHKINCIIQAKENNSGSNTGDANFWCNSGNATFDNINLFDLTAMFGAGNEPSTVEEFEVMFPDDYYPYSEQEVVYAGVETVESVGKNLFNPENILVGTYSKDTGTWKIPNDTRKALNMVFEENTQYTFSAFLNQSTSNSNIRLSVKYTDETENNLFLYTDSTSEVYKTDTTEAGKTVKEIWVDWDDSGYAEFRKLQIEKGAKAIAYSPYQRNTLVIPESIRNLDGYGWSAGNAYNYVDFENKKFHKRVGCVDLGTLEWTSKTDCYFKAVLSTIKPGKNEKVSNGCCKKYLLYDANRLMRATKGIALGVNHSNNVDVRDENYTDVTTFKTAMSGVLLYYELATEEVTDISDLLVELDEDAFVLPVEAGGTLTFKNSLGDGYRIPVPNSEEYILKLSEVASNE